MQRRKYLSELCYCIIIEMTFRSKLARFGICEQIMPIPVVSTALKPSVPKPFENNIIQLPIGQYPPKNRPPTGTILVNTCDYIPCGYLPCDGSAVSCDTYCELFAVIGITYGDGDGHSTFHLPNLSNDCVSISYIIKYDTDSDIRPNIIDMNIGEYPCTEHVVPGTILLNTENGIPEGYLLCDGSAVSRDTYSILFETIGITYGEGDGHSTFHVPHITTECMPESRYIIKYDFSQHAVVEPIEVAEYFPEEYVVVGGIRSHDIIPDGFLRCDGATISRELYAALFDVIGTYYGEGDGYTTFQLPHLQTECLPDCIYIIKYHDDLAECV